MRKRCEPRGEHRDHKSLTNPARSNNRPLHSEDNTYLVTRRPIGERPPSPTPPGHRPWPLRFRPTQPLQRSGSGRILDARGAQVYMNQDTGFQWVET